MRSANTWSRINDSNIPAMAERMALHQLQPITEHRVTHMRGHLAEHQQMKMHLLRGIIL